MAAPQGVGRGPHRQHVVGVGVRHAVHQSLRVEQGRHLRAHACAGRRGPVLGHQRQLGDAVGVHPHDRAASRRRRLPHLPRDVLPARQGGAVRGVPRPREHDDHRRDLLGRAPTAPRGCSWPSARACTARHARELRVPGRRPARDRRLGDPVGHDGRGAILRPTTSAPRSRPRTHASPRSTAQ